MRCTGIDADVRADLFPDGEIAEQLLGVRPHRGNGVRPHLQAQRRVVGLQCQIKRARCLGRIAILAAVHIVNERGMLPRMSR